MFTLTRSSYQQMFSSLRTILVALSLASLVHSSSSRRAADGHVQLRRHNKNPNPNPNHSAPASGSSSALFAPPSPDDVVAYLYTDPKCPPHVSRLVKRNEVTRNGNCAFVDGGMFPAVILLVEGSVYSGGKCTTAAPQPGPRVNQCFKLPNGGGITGISLAH